MKKTIVSVFAAVLALGCGNSQKEQQTSPLPVKTAGKKQTEVKVISVDSLISTYIHHSGNELVVAALKDNSVTEEASFDQEIKTDSANYLVYNIGHDRENDAGHVFASDSWIYVDTLKRKVFEYKPDGKLVEWKR